MQELIEELETVKGIFLQSDLKENKTIYTFSGEPVLGEKDSFNGECKKLSEIQRLFIDEQINFLIESKYNFIHYNPFPSCE